MIAEALLKQQVSSCLHDLTLSANPQHLSELRPARLASDAGEKPVGDPVVHHIPESKRVKPKCDIPSKKARTNSKVPQ
jgi:hypothetical protein